MINFFKKNRCKLFGHIWINSNDIKIVKGAYMNNIGIKLECQICKKKTVWGI